MPIRNVSPQVATTRSRVGGLSRRNASPERVAAARAELRIARAEDYIQKLLSETPPLTDAERLHLSRLLGEPDRAGT